MALFDPGEHPTEFPAEVVSDFTVAEIAAWARTKPADEAYNYMDRSNCAIGQFLRETRRAAEPLVGFGWRDGDGPEHSMDQHFWQAACPCGAPSTFGAFADRLEALL